MKTLPSLQQMQRATDSRDRSYDGLFVVAVTTTGIFCRPSCPARKPRHENMEFFGSAQDALLRGYRPCKRCRPMDPNGPPPDWVRRLHAFVDAHPTERVTDGDLRGMAIEPARVRRYFRSRYGMTFHGYQRARRMGLALRALHDGGDLLAIGLDHGFESSSGFREAFKQVFGEPPGRGRATDCIVTCPIETPIGMLVAGATDEGVCLLEFSDRPAFATQIQTLRQRMHRTLVPGTNRHLEQLTEELQDYFAGRRKCFTGKLVYPGTRFQQAVWDALRQIPFGETISYEELAGRVGSPSACRAVGRANGENRIVVIIPCHRVIQKNGQLRGYGGGLWRKQFLLDHERRVAGGGFDGTVLSAAVVQTGR